MYENNLTVWNLAQEFSTVFVPSSCCSRDPHRQLSRDLSLEKKKIRNRFQCKFEARRLSSCAHEFLLLLADSPQQHFHVCASNQSKSATSSSCSCVSDPTRRSLNWMQIQSTIDIIIPKEYLKDQHWQREVFSFRPRRSVHCCIYFFPSPNTLVRTLANTLVKTWPKRWG